MGKHRRRKLDRDAMADELHELLIRVDLAAAMECALSGEDRYRLHYRMIEAEIGALITRLRGPS